MPRPPMSDEQKIKLSIAQRRYMQNDPRWHEHRAKLAASMQRYTQSEAFREACAEVSERTRWKLFDEEAEQAKAMLSKGRNFEYVAEHLRISEEVLRRELKAMGIETRSARGHKRVRRTKGFWGSLAADL